MIKNNKNEMDHNEYAPLELEDSHKTKEGKVKKIVKKGLTLSLCAVLAGGLAAGTFEGVNRVTGWNDGTRVEAAAANDSDVDITLTKSSKKSDDGKEVTDSSASGSTTVKGSLDVSDIAEEAMPSVVSITTKSIQEVQTYFGMFGYGGYAPQQQEVEGSGSGIIIGKNDGELLIATNYHVVEGANTLSVAFVDGTACEATVKGFDDEKDLAVVSVSLKDIEDDTMDEITIATIGNSDDLRVGEQVVAIGNALGYGQSVTTGIVSAKNRRLDANSKNSANSQNGTNLIQTDAAINPGNSGGALLNMNGEVVGINSAKLASTEVEGMCYAIAITDVEDILETLMNEEAREKLADDEHGVLGITGSTVSDEAVNMYGIPAGVFVSEVSEGQGADKAGLKTNSVITKFNGKTVSSINQLIEYLCYYEPGEEVELTVQVQSGNGYEEKKITVTLSENQSASTEDGQKDDSGRSTLKRGYDRDEEPDEEDIPDDEEPDDFGSLFEEWTDGFKNQSARSYYGFFR